MPKKLFLVVLSIISVLLLLLTIACKQSSSKPKITLSDASTILNISSELPLGMSSSFDDSQKSFKLFSGDTTYPYSGGYTFQRGNGIGQPSYYMIGDSYWIVNSDITLQDAMGEAGKRGSVVDIGYNSTAMKDGNIGDGFEMLMIKHQHVFVSIISWYTHPQDSYIDIVPLGKIIAERLNNYDCN